MRPARGDARGEAAEDLLFQVHVRRGDVRDFQENSPVGLFSVEDNLQNSGGGVGNEFFLVELTH